MERLACEVDGSELVVSDLDLLGVVALIEPRVDLQAGVGCGRCDRVDHDCVADQRTSAPGLADVTEEPVLNLVPLRGAGREVADADLQAGGVREALEFGFP